MSVQQFATLLGIVLGFVAGVYFCIGSAEMRSKNIRELAGTYWDSNPHINKFFITLKSDYLCGGFALVISFILQFLSAVPGEFPATKLFAEAGTGAFVAASVGASVGVLLWFYRRWIISKLRAELELPAAQPKL